MNKNISIYNRIVYIYIIIYIQANLTSNTVNQVNCCHFWDPMVSSKTD
jgi:hypothetical protein